MISENPENSVRKRVPVEFSESNMMGRNLCETSPNDSLDSDLRRAMGEASRKS